MINTADKIYRDVFKLCFGIPVLTHLSPFCSQHRYQAFWGDGGFFLQALSMVQTVLGNVTTKQKKQIRTSVTDALWYLWF